ncbi:hypothetical protein HK096_001735, partial [Nowakowskiella sp. JEL0078]
LCGYLPFDSDSQMQELQNILSATFKFEPDEYWFDISDEAKDFISKLLILDPKKRMTAKEALSHPWLEKLPHVSGGVDLMRGSKEHFNPRRTFKKAVDAIRLINRVSNLSKSKESLLAEYAPAAEDSTGEDGGLLVFPRAE